MGLNEDSRWKCVKCKREIEDHKVVVFGGKIECYECWVFGINTKKVKALREQLSQYIEIGPNEPKENLTLEQLREVRKILSDNYFGEFDERSKEILNALVWTGEDVSGVSLGICIRAIEREIKRLERISEPQPPKIYTLNCPFCNKKFSCELKESSIFTGAAREAKDELNEKRVKHIREIHGEGECESDSDDNNIEPQANSPPKSNLPNSTKNKPPWPLIIAGVLLVSSLLIVSIFLVSQRKTKKVK